MSGTEAINLSCTNCSINTYKAEPGNTTVCTDCPENSSTNGVTGATTATECVCDVDWFRGVGESVLQSCGRSPSAVRNLRITRGDVLAAEWDIPSDLGNRNQTSYGVDLLETLSGMTTSVFIISMTEYNLDTVSSYTEYTITVTSRNAISSVSNEFYESSLTFLSSFPDVTMSTYIDNYLSWSFTLYAVSDYQFQLSYTSTQTGSNVSVTLNSSSCVQNTNTYECRVLILNLNASSGVSLSLSPLGPNVGLSSGTITVGTTTTIPGPFTTMMLIYYVIIPIAGCIIVVITLLLFISCCLICYCWKRGRKVEVCDDTINLEEHHEYQYITLQEGIEGDKPSFSEEINSGDLQKECIIWTGELGDIWKGSLSRNNQKIHVAIKICSPVSDEKNTNDFLREASVMKKFSHRNVISLISVILKNPITIVTPYMENGSLDKYLIYQKNNVTLKQLVTICHGVSCGMKYLSMLGFVHRDLTDRNILLDKDLTPKITDFGLSRETEDFYRVQTASKIPIRWTAPESIQYRKFDTMSDVWNFGILMWVVMSFGEVPYGDMDNSDVMDELLRGYRLPAPDSCPTAVYNLMLECWHEIPHKRPNFCKIQASLMLILEKDYALYISL